MNILYSIYFALPNFTRLGFFGKAINKIFGLLLKKIFDTYIPSYLNRTSKSAGYGLNTEQRDEIYILSLTSFPERMNEIWISIETLLRQSLKPDKIILWLAEDQFPERKLPESVTKLQERGLTIEYVDDLKSHKKYFYSFLRYPEANIITADDDLYYPRDFIKNVITLHKQYPYFIATNRAHKITFNNNKINPYRLWKHNVTDTIPSNLLMATGGAGTLYPPNALHKDVLMKEVFMSICQYADDIWLKIMALRNNIPVITNKTYNKDFISIGKTQNIKLVSTNVQSGGNDMQLINVLKHYNLDSIK